MKGVRKLKAIEIVDQIWRRESAGCDKVKTRDMKYHLLGRCVLCQEIHDRLAQEEKGR